MKTNKSQLRRLIEEEIKLISETGSRNPMYLQAKRLVGLDHAKAAAKNLQMAIETEFFDPIEHKKTLLTLIDLVLKLE